MTRLSAALSLLVTVSVSAAAQQASSCRILYGRANHPTDGGARIWEIGTHHEFAPDVTSFQRVDEWIHAGVTPAMKELVAPDSMVLLYGDFEICPTEPFRQGAAQKAVIKSLQHRHYVKLYAPEQ